HRSAIKDSKLRSKLFTENFGRFAPDHGMRFGSKFRSGSLSSSDRPDRFISNDQLGSLLRRDRVERPHALPAQNIVRHAGFTLLKNFPDAADGGQPAFQSRL